LFAAFFPAAAEGQADEMPGVYLLYLPPYSPDYNPIEKYGQKGTEEYRSDAQVNRNCYL
jgi:hypothetical protein